MLAVVGAGVDHVLEGHIGVHAKALSEALEPLRPEGAIRINVSCLALTPSSNTGIWHVTQRVWQSCVFPIRNLPKTSVSKPVLMPPSSSLSSSVKPVVSVTRDSGP